MSAHSQIRHPILDPERQLLEEQAQLLERIASGGDLDECLTALTRTASRLNPGTRARILLADLERSVFYRALAADIPPSFTAALRAGPIDSPLNGTCGRAVATGTPVACADIANAEDWPREWRSRCLVQDVRAVFSTPVTGSDGCVLGSFMLCFDRARAPSDWERRLAAFGAHLAGIAIERDRSVQAVRAGAERYRALFESIDEGFCVVQMVFDDLDTPIDYIFLETNPAFEKRTGLRDAVGKSMRALAPKHEEHWFRIYGDVALTGRAARFENYAHELGRWFDVYAYRVGEPEERKVSMLFSDITARKKSQQEREILLGEVEAERQQLSTIFQYAPSFMCVLRGPHHVFERANELLFELIGTRDIIGKSVREALPGFESQGLWEVLDQVFRTGEAFVGTDMQVTFNRSPEGASEERYLDFVYQPLRDAAGSVTGVFLQGVDLTRRKLAENALRDSEETLRRIIEAAKDYAILSMDTDGRFTSWNAGAQRLFGYGDREVMGQHFEMLFTPEDRQQQVAQQELSTARESGVAENERWHQRKDGSRVFASGLTQPIFDASGTLVGYTKICQDRSAQHEARLALERELVDSQRLQEVSTRLIAEGDFNALVEEILGAAIAVVHADKGTVHLADTDKMELKLLASEGADPDFQQFFAQLPVSDQTCCMAALKSGRREVVADFTNAPDYAGTRSAADHLKMGVRATQSTPLVTRSGRLLGMLSTHWGEPYQLDERGLRFLDQLARQAADLIERHQSEAALRNREKQLRELSQSLEQRVARRTSELQEQAARLRHMAVELASAEHRERKRLAALLHDDLQQLLVAANMQIAMIRPRMPDEQTTRAIDQAIRWIEEAADAARDLTRQLRPPALYEDGLIPALRWLSSEMLERHRLKVTISGTNGAQMLNDDIKALLFECVREMLFNIVKYAEVDRATVCVDESSNCLRITVIDHGQGFDAESLKDQPPRSGMGLFSIRERLAALGGKLKLETAPGEGTSLELEVPISAALDEKPSYPAVEGPTAERQGETPTTSTPGERLRVLVVDDHAIVREGIVNILAADPRLVVVGQAADGIEAIQGIERYHPDVVLMDINMPRMNGIEAAREISQRWPDVRLIGISVQGDDTTEKSMLEAGAESFIPKSGNADHVVAAILQSTESAPSS